MKTNLVHEPPILQGELVQFPKKERQAMSEKKFNYVNGIRSVDLHSTTKLVGIILATYADYETGICYPTIQTLMADSGLSNRVVCHHLRELEKVGLLVAKRANGRNTKYKFIAENISKAVTQSHQLRKVTSDFDDIEAVTLIHEAVTLSTQSSDAESHKHLITTINYKEQPVCISEPEKTQNKIEVKKSNLGKAKTTIPENFEISVQVQKWANEKNFKHLEQHLEYFISKCEANGYKYLNWDSAFKTAIRDDWAKLNTVQQQPYQPRQQAQQVPLIGSNKKQSERTVSTVEVLEVRNV